MPIAQNSRVSMMTQQQFDNVTRLLHSPQQQHSK